MHRALGIDDVLRLVVKHLEPTRYTSSVYLPLALINRAFSEHALDKIWERPKLWDLAQRMDNNCWYIEVVENTPSEDGHSNRSSPPPRTFVEVCCAISSYH
jgi:hypothetical protein